jgi:hypothetical protein
MPYVLDVSEPWFDEALDPKDVAKCDLIKPMLVTEAGFNATDGKAVSGTFAQTMTGAGTMWLSFRPRIGACLAWRADGDTGATYRGVYVRDVVAGTGGNVGQYQVTYAIVGTLTGTNTTAGIAVAESPLAINGIHRSPASHMQRQRAARIRVKKRLAGMA